MGDGHQRLAVVLVQLELVRRVRVLQSAGGAAGARCQPFAWRAPESQLAPRAPGRPARGRHDEARQSTHREAPELAHDALERRLVLAQEDRQLLVLVLERPVLEHELRRELFDPRLELLWGKRRRAQGVAESSQLLSCFSSSWRSEDAPCDRSVLNRRRGKPTCVWTACSCSPERTPQATEPSQRLTHAVQGQRPAGRTLISAIWFWRAAVTALFCVSWSESSPTSDQSLETDSSAGREGRQRARGRSAQRLSFRGAARRRGRTHGCTTEVWRRKGGEEGRRSTVAVWRGDGRDDEAGRSSSLVVLPAPVILSPAAAASSPRPDTLASPPAGSPRPSGAPLARLARDSRATPPRDGPLLDAAAVAQRAVRAPARDQGPGQRPTRRRRVRDRVALPQDEQGRGRQDQAGGRVQERRQQAPRRRGRCVGHVALSLACARACDVRPWSLC